MLSLKIDQSRADGYAEKMWKHIQQQLARVIKDNGLKATKDKNGRIKRSAILLSPDEKAFLISINKEQEIKKILSAQPSELRSLIRHFESANTALRTKTDNMNRVLYNVFVSNIYMIKKKFDGFKFVNGIGLQTCPYCNRSYIHSVNKRGVVRPQIDHFYPKSLFPYLGLSFYNLIPSCSVCNGTTAKGERDSLDEGLTSPYEIKSDDFKFSFDLVTLDDFRVKLNRKIDVNDEYFRLEEFYQHHGDVAHELYTKLYREGTREHFELLQKSLQGLGFDMDEVYRFITCGYLADDELHKRPLSKLTKDISEELGLK